MTARDTLAPPVFIRSMKVRWLWAAATVVLAVALIALAAIIRAHPESELDRRLLEQIGAWGD
jgi:hypothetical protein